MIICFPHKPGAGGPGSFQTRFEKELLKAGWSIIYKNKRSKPDLIFIVGGTKSLIWLIRMKLKGVPVLYRLDGIGWLHRKKKVGFKKYLIEETRNWSKKFIHAFIADNIVYQSKFVQEWWNKKRWRKRKYSTIIYNGVTIPKLISLDSTNRLVILEGTIDYTPYAIQLINELARKLPDNILIELYGKFEDSIHKKNLNKRIDFKGFLSREKVNSILSGSVFLSLDINPACPNTVIEAMACGAPVVAFDTGSLSELVSNNAGIIVPYGSDPWQLAYPDSESLISAIITIFKNYKYYSMNCRKLAENKFSLETMTAYYLDIIKQTINKNIER